MEGGRDSNSQRRVEKKKGANFFFFFFFEEKTVSVRVEERSGGFPVKSEGWGGWGWRGLRVRVRGSLSALFIAQACRGKITKRRSRWPIFTLHSSHPKHSSSPRKDPEPPQTPSLFLSLSLCLRSRQVGPNLAADPAQVPDQDCFWVKGRPRLLRPRPCLLEPGRERDAAAHLFDL